MPLASTIDPAKTRFNALFIGRSGSGKSAAAYSIANHFGMTKVEDLDGRVRGGLVPWIAKDKIYYNYYPPITQGQGKTVFEQLDQSFAALLMETQQGRSPYKNIIVDSLTHEAVDFLLDAIPLTHEAGKGRRLGGMQLSGPEDYKYQANGIYSTLAFLKSLPMNIICTAHIVNKWGRPPGAGADDKFVENVIVGEQLSLTDKLAENVPSYFDHIIRFEKYDTGREIKFRCKFHGELERTSFSAIPYGWIDITGKDFFQVMLSYVTKPEEQAQLTGQTQA